MDLLFKEIKNFLVGNMDSEGQIGRNAIQLISFINDLESAGDIVEKNLIVLGQKKDALKLEFSKEGWEEILDLHGMVVETVSLSLSCFQLLVGF